MSELNVNVKKCGFPPNENKKISAIETDGTIPPSTAETHFKYTVYYANDLLDECQNRVERLASNFYFLIGEFIVYSGVSDQVAAPNLRKKIEDLDLILERISALTDSINYIADALSDSKKTLGLSLFDSEEREERPNIGGYVGSFDVAYELLDSAVDRLCNLCAEFEINKDDDYEGCQTHALLSTSNFQAHLHKMILDRLFAVRTLLDAQLVRLNGVKD